MRAPRVVQHLGVERLSAAQWRARSAGQPTLLGGLGYGLHPGAACVGARLLLGGEPAVDAWIGGEGPVHEGRSGSVRWRHDGEWLHGALELDESATDDGLNALSRQAYRDVFATLRDTGLPHLQRLWNYLPGINADGGGLERYRQFNAGRQLAFLEAGEAAFEGAPAACALGTRSGPFCVRFLAGRTRPLPIENPRQVSAYHYPSDYGPRSPTFSRAALVDAGGGQVGLLISGTSSIVGHETRHAGDVQAQTRETVANLRAVIAAAQAHTTARFDVATLSCTVYVRHEEHAALIRSTLEAEIGAGAPALRDALYLEADICRSDLMVEVEAHAFAAGEVSA